MRRLGTFLLPHPTLTVEQRLSAIHDAGFNTVCLDWEDEYLETEGPREKQPDMVAKHQLIIEHAHLSGYGANLMWETDNDGADWFVNRAINEINLCKTFNVKVGVIHVTWGLEAPPMTDVAIPRFLKIAEHAEKTGVSVAVENSVSAVHLDYLLNNIDSDRIGFCFDSGHQNCFTPASDLLADHGNRLIAMHLHDNNGKEDLHAIPFTGTINWNDVISKLNNTELFKNAVTLESTPPTNGGYDAYLNHQIHAFEAVKKIQNTSEGCIENEY